MTGGVSSENERKRDDGAGEKVQTEMRKAEKMATGQSYDQGDLIHKGSDEEVSALLCLSSVLLVFLLVPSSSSS